jgi:hypothetical protein
VIVFIWCTVVLWHFFMALPSFIIPKKDGRVHWISNQELNKHIECKVYNLAKIQDILNHPFRYKYFTKLDVDLLESKSSEITKEDYIAIMKNYEHYIPLHLTTNFFVDFHITEYCQDPLTILSVGLSGDRVSAFWSILLDQIRTVQWWHC